MFQFELTHHTLQIGHKPDEKYTKMYDAETGQEILPEFVRFGYNSAAKYINEVVTIEQFYDICLRGMAWKVGHYPVDKPSMKEEFVDWVQVIGLDFDKSDESPQEVVKRAESYGMRPNFWYYSFSQGSKPGNNFRLVWVLEKPIGVNQFKVVIDQIFKKFANSEPDKAARDASRIFYGTRHGGEFIDDTPLEIGVLGWLSVVDKLEEGMPFKNACRSDKDLSKEYKLLKDVPICKVNDNWWVELRGACWLWDKWEAGEHLTYPQQLALFSNLSLLERKDPKESILNDVWKFYNPEAYDPGTMDVDRIHRIFRTSTKALRICNGETIPDWLRKDKTIIPKHFKNSLEVVEKIFADEMPQIMEESAMTYVEVQTAMGKTEQYLRWAANKIKTNPCKIVIAAPTYSLLYELKDRLLRLDPEIENLIYLPPKKENIGEYDDFYYTHGLAPRKKKGEVTLEQTERSEVLHNVIGWDREEKKTFKVNGIYLLSHATITNLFMIAETDYLIIDENIENNVIYSQTIGIDNIATLKDGMDEQDYYLVDDFIDAVLRAEPGTTISNDYIRKILAPKVVENDEIVFKNPFSFSKFRNKQFNKKGCPGLYYMRNYQLIKTPFNGGSLVIHGRKPILDGCFNFGTRIKLFCATPQITLLRQEYPFVKEYNYDLVQNAGKIIQYTGITGAKGLSGKEYAEKYMKFVESKIGKDIPIITHKGACAMWEAAGFIVLKNDDGEYIHLGNNAGLDFMKGKKIAVVGKLEMAQEEYEKQWYIYKGNAPMPQMKTQKYDMYGVEILGRMYEDDFLANLQKEHLNKTITQAAGRARALREAGATVYVFANFIIKEADEIKIS